jgi:acetyl esterase
MPVDPQAQEILDELARFAGPPMHTLTPDQARKVAKAVSRTLADGEDVASVEDREIPGPGGPLPIRLYRGQAEGELPVLMYFHGGGWVICDLDSHDMICRRLANETGCLVMAVDYRLAPEHRYPAAAEDCYAATQWIVDNAESLGADGSRIVVSGDSAGGTLATVVAMMARDRGGPDIALQMLAYPATDYKFDTVSYLENADGYLLTRDTMRWFWDQYLGEEGDANEPYASPLRCDDLSNLPPAVVITAEYDPLRDEGEAYAERLRAAGAAVTMTRYGGMIHDFFRRFGTLDQGRDAVAQAAEAIRQATAKN